MANHLLTVLRGIMGTVAFVILLTPAACLLAETNGSPVRLVTPKERAEKLFQHAKKDFDASPTAERGWKVARAAFDWAEFATDDSQRESIALQGIAAARRGIMLDSKSVASRYYLPMNLGQLARTRTLGALKLVVEMEREFKRVREMDNMFDFAGADRNLGLLYLEAPPFSIGDSKKARQHLEKAVELSPAYPENRLNLIEAYIRWNELDRAQQELGRLQEILPAARKEFQGEEWVVSWVDWERRLVLVRQKLKTLEK